jgi:DNA-binding NtrC family response regulator
VIAATHAPLEEWVPKRRFRADLLYRLAVFPIRVPPLRERQEDIVPLAVAILNRLAARSKRSVPSLSQSVVDRLLAHPWRGNVRELENVLERALITSGRSLTLPSDLGDELLESGSPVRQRTLDQSIAVAIRQALERSGGRIYGKGGAAERLGVKPTTLQSKMRKLGVSR